MASAVLDWAINTELIMKDILENGLNGNRGAEWIQLSTRDARHGSWSWVIVVHLCYAMFGAFASM